MNFYHADKVSGQMDGAQINVPGEVLVGDNDKLLELVTVSFLDGYLCCLQSYFPVYGYLS